MNRARSLRKTAANWSDAALWRVLANKPGLNAVSAVSHVERLLPRDAATFDVTGGRVHVRIAFHYVPWRLKYLIETVEAASRLPFEEIDIWIDTNTSQLKREAARIPGKFQIAVWNELDHPFKLTWMHRGEMGNRLNDFDAFIYLEDDIIIPNRTMRRWLWETPRLAPLGFLPGFVRVEEDLSGALFLADYRERLSSSCITHVEGRPYLSTAYPYQACWVYDAAQMHELAARPNFLSGEVENPDFHERDGLPGIREQVALGLQFVSVPKGHPSRALVPLTDDLKIAPDALVFHSPCNYAQRKPPHPAGIGQIPLSAIFTD